MAAGRVRKTGGLRATCGGRIGHPSLDCAQNLILHILTAEFIWKYRKKCQHKKLQQQTSFGGKKTLQYKSPTRGPRTACNTPGSVVRLAATFVNYAYKNYRIIEASLSLIVLSPRTPLCFEITRILHSCSGK